MRRYHIGFSISVVRQFFWDACDGFSLAFPMLVGVEGAKFRAECRAKGKEICVWTVNDTDEMRVALSGGIKAILTDQVALFNSVKNEVCLLAFATAYCVSERLRERDKALTG
jgi:hypothetical protein